ncbi:MAG: hypothetical protein IPN13_24855 [Bacteroidetes bacterium]|nr:hypothetical protein [Bacteroidota bacterium]
MIRATLHSLITSFKIASQALIIISILLYSLSIAKGAGTWNYIGNYNGGNCDLTFYFTIGQRDMLEEEELQFQFLKAISGNLIQQITHGLN